MKNIHKILLLVVIQILIHPLTFAEEIEIAEDMGVPEEEKKVEGWTFGADVGATANWNLNRKFVGIPDGHYVAFGGKIGGTADFLRGRHEWKNSISWLETFNLIPAIEGLIKSADQLNFETTYLLNFNRWSGYFAQFRLNTSTFWGVDKRASDVSYVVSELDGTQNTTVANRLDLTNPFQPLYLQESTGIFVRFLDYSYFTWLAKIGPAARQNFAKDALIITEEANNTISLNRLQNTYQIGPFFGTNFFGSTLENKLGYGAGVELLYGLFRWPMEQARTPMQRLNIEIYANLSYKFFSWMALTWDLKAIRIPDILEDFQVQSNVLLTFSYKY